MMRKSMALVCAVVAAGIVGCSSAAPAAVTSVVTSVQPGPTVTTAVPTTVPVPTTKIAYVTETAVSTIPTTVVNMITQHATTTVVSVKTATETVTMQPAGATVENGDYVIGSDIKTGVWQCRGGGGNLYWEVTTKTGDIVNNGLNSIAQVTSDGFSVTLQGCDDVWTKVG